MKKVLITGGSGFIGSHVVDAMLEAGHTVTVLDKGVPPHRKGVRHEDVDLLDFPSLMNASKGQDFIFHLAATSNVNHMQKAPVYSVQQNVVGSCNVLEAARHAGVERVVLASTVWVYNAATDTDAPLDEDAPIKIARAGHLYTSSKIASELLCHSYMELFSQGVTILRYGVPYGERMREELLIPSLIRKAVAGEPIVLTGDGSQFRKFIYVGDLAKAHVLAMSERAAGQTYNLEGTERVSVLEVAKGVQEMVGRGGGIEFAPSRAGDFSGRDISNRRTLDDLGWQPSVEFPSGLKRTVDWFLAKWANGGIAERAHQ